MMGKKQTFDIHKLVIERKLFRTEDEIEALKTEFNVLTFVGKEVVTVYGFNVNEINSLRKVFERRSLDK